jgi:hypothetical protein
MNAGAAEVGDLWSTGTGLPQDDTTFNGGTKDVTVLSGSRTAAPLTDITVERQCKTPD